ncbi:MAG: hypothetical protein KGL10_08320 [Alphaproteobacteria bacterium]|nr:hypothetical protein [Alphaproteobacteria bacterium]MDE2337303.1 hypothetical protein [Alphaproteobacteria bacterium]
MSAINAKEYYETHKSAEREYIPIVTARAVKAGETVTVNSVLGIDAMVKAPEDGYQISGSGGYKKFFTEEQLKEKTVPAEGLELPAPKEDIPEEELEYIQPVKKGEKIYVNPGIPVAARADEDGFIVKDKDSDYSAFMSNYELTSLFNYAGGKYETHEQRAVVALKDAPRLKGIILQENVTFAFRNGEYTAPKGSLLFVNADDEDGYTVTPRTNLEFRVAPASRKKGRSFKI